MTTQPQRKRERALLVALTCAGAAIAMTAIAQRTETEQATFVDAAGKKIGTATLTQTPAGVLIVLDVSGLPPGEHGFHLHEIGKCDGATRFKSAGDHYAPQGRGEHGFHAAGGPHAGDMPNLFVGKDGVLRAHVVNERVALGAGSDKAPLLDADGTALVIHAGPDDYHTQPSGGSGDRIACAVLQRAR